MHAHAEWADEGLRLWLRVHPAHEQSTLNELTQRLLPWLHAQGERLIALTSNGRALWSDAPSAPAQRPDTPRPSHTPPQETP